MPAVVARPWRWVAASNSPFSAPAPARARRRRGSTRTWLSPRRSITSPPSQTARPATPWPPARTAIGRPWARPKPTAVTTSAVSWQQAIIAG
jgi:hypothetical protein